MKWRIMTREKKKKKHDCFSCVCVYNLYIACLFGKSLVNCSE